MTIVDEFEDDKMTTKASLMVVYIVLQKNLDRGIKIDLYQI